MRHFIVQVLPEADLFGICTKFDKKEVDAGEEVAKRLVVNKLAFHGTANRSSLNRGFAGQLRLPVKKWQLDLFNLGKALVRFAAL